MSSNAKAVLVGVLWFLGGGAFGVVTGLLMALGALGGQHSPPAWWWLAVAFGAFVLPLLLTFGWIPTVLRIKQERPAWKAALVTLAVTAALWTATMVAWELGRPKV